VYPSFVPSQILLQCDKKKPDTVFAIALSVQAPDGLSRIKHGNRLVSA